MRIKIVYEEYERYSSGCIRSLYIKGKTLRSCLLQMFDELSLYDEGKDILEREKYEEKRKYTNDELIENATINDGCDYIFSIVNIDTNESYYDSGDYEDAGEVIESKYDRK